MILQGTHEFPQSREQVFAGLLDPEILSRTLPGCDQLEKTGENQYAGILKMKVGPVQGVFRGKVQLSDIVEPESYHLSLEGSGAPGFVNGNGTLRLEETAIEGQATPGTTLHYEIDAKVGGKIASIGQRLVESSAKVITKQGLKGLEKQLALQAAEGSVTVETVADGAAASPSDIDPGTVTPVVKPESADQALSQPPPVSVSTSEEPLAESSRSTGELAGEVIESAVDDAVEDANSEHSVSLSKGFYVLGAGLLVFSLAAVFLRTCG